MSGQLQMAKQAWGEELPDWIAEMALECEASSANKVAKKLGRSAAMISQALSNKYPADLGPLERRFLGVFRNLAVNCPALGVIPANECQDWQAKSAKFINVNPLRVTMFRTCNRCEQKNGSAEQ